MKGLSKMALCVSPKTQLCGIAAFSETATYILNVIASFLIHVMFSTFIHRYYFRNFLTVTLTERDNNVKNGGLKKGGGFSMVWECAQGTVQVL